MSRLKKAIVEISVNAPIRLSELRTTEPNKLAGFTRVMLGIIFLMTGFMKLFLPEYGNAWSIQLIEANIPFYDFTYWFVPIFEVVLGSILLVGYHAKLAAASVFPLMIVAVYVHLTVFHPGAFPSQPQFPYMPIIVIIMALLVLLKGGGSWSIDLKSDK